MKIKNFIKEIILENLNENIKLYHRIMDKNDLGLIGLLKSVINNGLVRHDNGEVGNVIWFSNNYDDYSKNAKFVVSINYNQINKEKYQIYYDGNNGYVYRDIPFEDLDIVKIPTLVLHSKYVESSYDLIRLINDKTVTPEKLNNLPNVTLYGDIFDKYVQPYINIPNFIGKLDNNKIKIINIFN